MLPQNGNPINSELDNFKGLQTDSLKGDRLIADAMLAYQLPNGGFRKEKLSRYALGIPTAAEVLADHENTRYLGSIDNESTITELAFLADIYKRTKDTKYRDSMRRVVNYLLEAQSATGGFPQFYPDRSKTSYSNHATFNDGAMIRVLIALQKAERKESPFDADIFTSAQMSKIRASIKLGVDFILKAQNIQNGTPTAWCAQHGMKDYKPKTGRSYELPSNSGSESVGIVAFLMSRPQTPEVKYAVDSALNWFRNNMLKDYVFDKTKKGQGVSPIVKKQGSNMWYRFYDLRTNEPMFVNRDGTVFRDITKMDAERKDGYRWGGNWGQKILDYAKKVGY